MAAMSFIILLLDVPIPNELRAFFFYAQVVMPVRIGHLNLELA